ncbi:MAG TPA: Gfo/Idh/MocA family oxidoreductase [Planctomycetota bacterium]|nr:Gfo/Idh/MocA family oxidoreductase [Planctomycetota bacterium]
MSQADKNSSGKSGPSRRGFFKAAAAAAVAVGMGGASKAVRADEIPTPKADTTKFIGGKFPTGPVQATGRVIGANDRILCAVIGVGGQGFGAHVKTLKAKAAEINIEQIAACDVYQPRNERAAKEIQVEGRPTPMTNKDYRKLLENKDIDAVWVATPEHWHAQISCHAMEAGKHVYVEKPMTRYLDEAFQMVDCQKRTGKVVQLGIQYTSNQKWHDIGAAVRAGKIGPLVSGQGSYCRNAGKGGEWNYGIDNSAGPENLDWDMWLGSAPKRPWNDDAKARFFRYRKYWDYSAGILGDLMPHKLGPFLIASGTPEYPTRVCSLGTRKISLDREVDDTVEVMAEFPSGWTMLFTGSTVNEQGLPDMLRGHKGTVQMGGGGAKISPERPYAEEVEGGEVAKDSGGGIGDHHKNFIEAIRTGKKPNCDVELGAKIQTILALAEISSRTNRMCVFDEKTREIKAG